MTEKILFIVIGMALLVLLAYAVFLLVHIRHAVEGLTQTIDHLNRRLPVILKNIEEITTNAVQTTGAVQKQVDDLALTVKRINGSVNFYLEKEEIFRQEIGIPVEKTFRTYSAFAKGIRAFLDALKTGTTTSVGSGRSL
jgi:uncharacterized protein YoxC